MANFLTNLADTNLIDVAKQAFNAANTNLGDYPGVMQAMVDVVKDAYTAFEPKVTLHVQKQAEARVQTQVKDTKRTPLETTLRTLRNVAKAAGASDAALAALGIPSGGGPNAPTIPTRPVGSVNTSQRLQHLISWRDSDSQDNKKKPRGVMGCEIWVKLEGTPPTDENECTFVTLDSATPYLAVYDGTDGGKMAHYLLRWRMRDGSTGPWSETVSATVTG